MKRVLLGTLGLMMSITLAACSAQSTKPTNESTTRVARKQPKLRSNNKKMSFVQIKQGDYRGLQGHWRRLVPEDNGYDLKVSDREITDGQMRLTQAGLDGQSGLQPVKFQQRNGVMQVTIADQTRVAINFSVTFYPAGTTREYVAHEGDETNKKNVIVIWTSNNSYTEAFMQEDTVEVAAQAPKQQPAPWNQAKDKQLTAFMHTWQKSQKQDYEKYDGDHQLKTGTGMTYPDDLPDIYLDGKQGVARWSADGQARYPYNIVAIYHHGEGTIISKTYVFAFKDGKPVVLVNQSNNGEPEWYVDKDKVLNRAFKRIAAE